MGQGLISRLVADPGRVRVLKGEIWVSPEVLAGEGLSQDPRGVVDLASSLGADICFFHWPESAMQDDLKALVAYAHAAGLDCGLTMDGPFQRLISQRNVLDVLGELGRDPTSFGDLLAPEMEEISETLAILADVGIDLLMVSDDVGFAGGLYLPPRIFRQTLLPFYEILVRAFAGREPPVGWHADGNVEPLLGDLVACGFRFFSLEPECVDLLQFKKAQGPRAILVSGVRVDWLAAGELDRERQAECLTAIEALAAEGGFILASSCGLYNPRFLPNLRTIYSLVDKRFALSAGGRKILKNQ